VATYKRDGVLKMEYSEKISQLKEIKVMELNAGDKIKLTNGDIMIFDRLKRTKFVATMNGQSYNVPILMFDSVVEKIDIVKLQKEKKEEKNNILSTLKKGDYFYINKNGNAIVFKFEGLEGRKIIGINPINGGRTRIDITFEIGKLV
jgi:uncharacterized protein YjhX (UPF0386 family)